MNISTYISIASLCFAILSWFVVLLKNNGKDTEQRIIERTEVNCKLDMINNNVCDIKNDVATTKDEMKKIDNRLVVVEQSCKSAHHRLDTLEADLK